MKPNVFSSIRLPKMNRLPSPTKLSTFTKPRPIASKTSLPPGTSSTRAAKATCRPTPVATSFQSTRPFLFEASHAMPMSTARPKRPKSTRVMASTQVSQLQPAAGGVVVIVEETCAQSTCLLLISIEVEFLDHPGLPALLFRDGDAQVPGLDRSGQVEAGVRLAHHLLRNHGPVPAIVG